MSVILKLCVWRSAELCFVDDSIFFFYFCSVHIAHTTAAEGHRVDTQIANGMSKAAAAAAAATSAAYIFISLSHSSSLTVVVFSFRIQMRYSLL